MNLARIVLSICIFIGVIAGCTTTQHTAGSEKSEAGLKIMSYNIRGDKPSDGVNQWENRKEDFVNLIKFYEPDIVGMQEVKPRQFEDLKEALDDFNWIGMGERTGEFNVIFYDSSTVALDESSEKMLWLSETPEKQSKGWDAAHIRVVVSGAFTHTETGKKIHIYNTHLDHKGETAKIKGSELVLEAIQELPEDEAVALMGDLNFTEESDSYRLLTAPDSPLQDAYYISELPHVGPDYSFEGFKVKSNREGVRIDYIFVNEIVNVKTHSCFVQCMTHIFKFAYSAV
ncbi:MAG: endonuclease/exonuclease/phosphatase family protein, partial [Balneolaceae bacterium]